MRTISDHLRSRLADLPGIDEISNRLEGGLQIVSIAGKDITVSPFASDTEIEVALRLALSIPRKEPARMTEPTQPEPHSPDPGGGQPELPQAEQPASTPLPAVEMAPVKSPPIRVGKPIPAAGSYTPGSLKDLLGGLRNRKQNVMGEAVREAKRAHKALDLVAQTSADMRATTEDILNEVREFTNEIPDLEEE